MTFSYAELDIIVGGVNSFDEYYSKNFITLKDMREGCKRQLKYGAIMNMWRRLPDHERDKWAREAKEESSFRYYNQGFDQYAEMIIKEVFME